MTTSTTRRPVTLTDSQRAYHLGGGCHLVIERGMPGEQPLVGYGETLRAALGSLSPIPGGSERSDASILDWARGAGWITADERDAAEEVAS